MRDGQEYPFISEGGGRRRIHCTLNVLSLQVNHTSMVNQETSYLQYANES